MWRNALLVVLICGITAAPLLPTSTVQAQAGYTYRECSEIRETELPAQLEALALSVFAEGSQGLAIGAIVDRQWLQVDVDSVLDQEIERAIQRRMDEESYWNRLLSGWSGAKAEEFAQRVAEEVFTSAAVIAKIDALSEGIAGEVAAEIQALSARSASVSLLCVQEYVGAQYSSTLFELFAQQISAQVDSVEAQPLNNYEFSVAGVYDKALTGVGLIVVTQIVQRISVQLGKKIAGRVAGKIAGRLLGRLGSSVIPVAGWIIGAGLIVWDLVEGSQGALPQIQEALQSEGTKVAMREEVALAVEEGLNEEMASIARTIGTELQTAWENFCLARPMLCELPGESAQFKRILDNTAISKLEHLSSLVDFYIDNLGKDVLNAAITTGDFEEFLTMPSGILAILETTGSEQTARAWAELAGPRLDQLIALGIYQVSEPGDWSEARLSALLQLDDAQAIARLLQLDPALWSLYLALPTATLRPLLNDLSPADLSWLAEVRSTETSPSLAEQAAQLSQGTVSIDQLRAEAAAADIAEEAAPLRRAFAETALETMRRTWMESRRWVEANVLVTTSTLLLTLVAAIFLLVIYQDRKT